MKKIIYSMALLISAFLFFTTETKASDLDYEITSIHQSGQNLIVEGWGLIRELQHFIDSNTHKYILFLEGIDNDGFEGVYKSVSKTNLIKMSGVPKCPADAVGKQGRECWYEYENVGFRFLIDLSLLQPNSEYKMSIQIKATEGTYTSKIWEEKLVTKQEPVYAKTGEQWYNVKDKSFTTGTLVPWTDSTPPTDALNIQQRNMYEYLTYGSWSDVYDGDVPRDTRTYQYRFATLSRESDWLNGYGENKSINGITSTVFARKYRMKEWIPKSYDVMIRTSTYIPGSWSNWNYASTSSTNCSKSDYECQYQKETSRISTETASGYYTSAPSGYPYLIEGSGVRHYSYIRWRFRCKTGNWSSWSTTNSGSAVCGPAGYTDSASNKEQDIFEWTQSTSKTGYTQRASQMMYKYYKQTLTWTLDSTWYAGYGSNQGDVSRVASRRYKYLSSGTWGDWTRWETWKTGQTSCPTDTQTSTTKTDYDCQERGGGYGDWNAWIIATTSKSNCSLAFYECQYREKVDFPGYQKRNVSYDWSVDKTIVREWTGEIKIQYQYNIAITSWGSAYWTKIQPTAQELTAQLKQLINTIVTGGGELLGYNEVIVDEGKFVEKQITMPGGTETISDVFYGYEEPIMMPLFTGVVMADLDASYVEVRDDFVYVRMTPTKINNNNVLLAPFSCSVGGKFAYHQIGRRFSPIATRIMSDGTWFSISTKISSACSEGRVVVLEGNEYVSWIASNFVSYSGSGAKIITTALNPLENTPPIISASDKTLIVGDPFTYMDGVYGMDAEDGEVTNKITYSGDVDTSKNGVYPVTYSVTDSGGLKTDKVVKISVIEYVEPIVNTAPRITAFNQTIFIGDSVNYMKQVSASDNEDGDITYKVTYQNTVNNMVAGVYPVRYEVEDSEGLKAIKTVNIAVLDLYVPPIPEQPNDPTKTKSKAWVRFIGYDFIWSLKTNLWDFHIDYLRTALRDDVTEKKYIFTGDDIQEAKDYIFSHAISWSELPDFNEKRFVERAIQKGLTGGRFE